MNHGKKKLSGSRETSKNGPPLGLVIALAVAGGVVIGSAGTYYFFKLGTAPTQSASPTAGGTPQAQTIAMPPQQQFTPAPQPPGEVPPGKVWSVEHGHWHDAPTVVATPAPMPAPATPETTLAPTPPAVTPAATTTPPPAVAPAEKKE